MSTRDITHISRDGSTFLPLKRISRQEILDMVVHSAVDIWPAEVRMMADSPDYHAPHVILFIRAVFMDFVARPPRFGTLTIDPANPSSNPPA
jgi:hypothetical protein